MPLKALTSSNYIYATLRYLVDSDRDITVPAGVMMVNSDSCDLYFRVPEAGEHISDLPTAHAIPRLELVKEQIEAWIKSGKLPYSSENVTQLSDQWWNDLSALLQFNVRLGRVQQVQTEVPEEELDLLYQAIVQPTVQHHIKSTRIDFAVRKALGPASRHFRRGEVQGYGRISVPVAHQVSDGVKVVIVEALNLATKDALTDAFELSGKLRNIQHSGTNRNVRILLGYKATAHGLNGEKPLVDFIKEETDQQMYDLDREVDEFRKAVDVELSSLNVGLFAQ